MEAAAIDLVCHDLPLHVVPSDVGIESLKPRSCAYSLRVILRDCSLTIVWFYSRTLKSHLMLGTRPFCSRFYYLPVLDTRGSRFCVPSSNHACDEYCPHDETLRIRFLRCAQSIYFSCCYRAHLRIYLPSRMLYVFRQRLQTNTLFCCVRLLNLSRDAHLLLPYRLIVCCFNILPSSVRAIHQEITHIDSLTNHSYFVPFSTFDRRAHLD